MKTGRTSQYLAFRHLFLIAFLLASLTSGLTPPQAALAAPTLNFAAAVNYAVGSQPRSVATGDLNGDGDLDLVAANYGGDNVSVLLGAGNGTFAAASNYAAGSAPVSVATGDLDHDGYLDLVTVNYSSGTVSVLPGFGNGAFDDPVGYAVGSAPISVTAGDLDGDGNLDLAVANYTGGNVSVLLGFGDGTFDAAANFTTGANPHSVGIGDLDGDGNLDLAVANAGSNIVSVLLGLGDGTFGAAANYTTGANPHSVTAGDLDGDGDLDLVTANYGDHNVSVLLGAGDGTFAAAVNYTTGMNAYSVTAGDLDGDNKLDLAVANRGGNDVSILHGNGNGTFSAAVNYVAGLMPYAVTKGDLDGDGDLDLITVSNNGYNVNVLRGNGDGTFIAAVNYGVGNSPRSASPGDFNGDGNLDLAVANYSSNDLNIVLGNGDANFSVVYTYTVGTNPFFVAAGDLDGDSDLDLAVANSASDNVSVLLGNGDGTFVVTANPAVGDNPRSVAMGDFDGDGGLDLAVANGTSNNVSVLLGDGNGAFAAAAHYAAGAYPTSLAAGDLDDDGDLDLVTANINDGKVSVLRGNGDGSFTSIGAHAAGTIPHSVAMGDLDGDGDQDLAVANYSSNNVSILLGDGAGSFAAAAPCATGTSPASVAMGDLDRDGDLDLVTANTNSHNLSMLLGNGNGTFASAVTYPMGLNPFSVIASDLDGDGDLDLAAANYGSNNVSVMLNTSPNEIEAYGNSSLILDGDITPSASDDTDFGAVVAAGGAIAHTFTVSNTGTADLTVSGITFEGVNAADFSLSGISFPVVIHAPGSAAFQVTFDPSAAGLRSATLNIASDDADENPYDFAIQGVGLNSAPVANDDSGPGFITDEDTAFLLDNVLANDSDVDGDLLSGASYDDSGVLGSLSFIAGAPGSLDPLFDGDGMLAADLFTSHSEYLYALAQQPDGKLIAAGDFFDGVDFNIVLARYHPDGSPDLSFGTDGMQWTNLHVDGMQPNDHGYAMRLQMDGKILVAGSTDLSGSPDFALARFNLDGSLDANFGGSGWVSTDFSGGEDIAVAMALLPDGRILLGGHSWNGTDNDFALARYNADGSLDGTFGAGGRVTSHLGGPHDDCYSLALLPDGKILAGGQVYDGTSEYDFALARYNTSGALDSTFGSGGWVTTDFGRNSLGRSLLLLPDGLGGVAGLLLAGYATDGVNADFALARYTLNGSLDGAFGTGGLVRTDFGSEGDVGSAAILQPAGGGEDAGILVAGSTLNGTDPDFLLARYTLDGALDVGFDGDGWVTTDFGSGSYDNASALLAQPDGKILVGGWRNPYDGGENDVALARYVGVTGFFYDPNGQLEHLAASEVLTETFMYVASDGFLTDTAVVSLRVVGVNDAPIAVDDAYGTDEDTELVVDAPGLLGNDSDVDEDPLKATLEIGPLHGLLDLNLDGSFTYMPAANYYGLDSFTYIASDGVLTDTGLMTITVAPANDTPVAVDDSGPNFITDEDTAFTMTSVLANDSDVDGDLLYIQNLDTSGTRGLVSFGAAGGLDPGFGSGGRVVTDFGSSESPMDVALQPDGKLLVCGQILDPIPGQYDFIVARYNADGSPDDTFGSDGWVQTNFTESDTCVGLAVQPDGKIIAIGDTMGTSFSDFALARYNPDGSLDGTFGVGGLVMVDLGGREHARAVALQPDGKILVAGDDNNQDFALARYDSDGSLDRRFGVNGLVLTDFFGGYDNAFAALLQPDGKIVVGGSARSASGEDDFALARYNPDGSLDVSFGVNGKVVTDLLYNDYGGSLALYSDGRIALAGQASSDTWKIALVVYNPDGSLDTGFDSDGIVMTDLDWQNFATGVAWQADGKLLVAGSLDNGSQSDFSLLRYNTDGSLDLTFDGDGWARTDLLGASNDASGLVLQPDGKIVVAGYVWQGDGYDFALARYNGGMELVYDPNGQFEYLAAGEVETDTFRYMASDGFLTDTAAVSITVVGVNDEPLAMDDAYSTDEDTTLAVTAPGVLGNDTDVDGDALLLTLDLGPAEGDLALAADGSFVYTPTVNFNGLVTFTYFISDSLAFSRATVTITISSVNDEPLAVDDAYSTDEDTTLAVTAPGVLANDSDADSDPLAAWLDTLPEQGGLNLLPDGAFTYNPAPDFNGEITFTYFISDGLAFSRATVEITINQTNDAPAAMDDWGLGFTTDEDTPFNLADVLDNDADPDGDALSLVGYDTGSTLGSLSYLPGEGGLLDSAFGGDGLVTTDFSGNGEWIHALVVQPDGKIVAAGVSNDSYGANFALARYNVDGTLDASFGVGGRVITAFSNPVAGALTLALQPDGKIIAAGYAFNGTNNDFALVRYHANGSLDTSFGGDGLVMTDFSVEDEAHGVVVQPDGKIIAAGYTHGILSDADFALVRYNTDGSLDAGFGSNGLVITDFSGDYDFAEALVLQSDGKLIAAGYIESLNSSLYALARYNADGTLDASFGSGGLVTTSFGDHEYAYGRDMLLQPDGKIVLAGMANDADTSQDFALARYNADGTLDASFGSGGLVTSDYGSYEHAFGVVRQVDGKLVAGGIRYNTMNYAMDMALVRYNTDGSPDSSFGSNGLVTTDFGQDDNAYALALQPDGRLVAGGYTTTNSNDFALARYTTAPGSFAYDPNGQFEWLQAGQVATDTFTYEVSDGALTDRATVSLTIMGVNDAPAASAGPDQAVDEGQVVRFTGGYTDPDSVIIVTSSTVAWTFGDKTAATGTLTPTHIYVDNGVYTVTLVITDEMGAVGSDWLVVTVTNVDPVLSEISDQSVVAGQVLTVTASFFDPGSEDVLTLDVDWGDGLTETFPLPDGTEAFPLDHIYADDGTYTVKVTVTDDDGGESEVQFLAIVSSTSHRIWLPVISK